MDRLPPEAEAEIRRRVAAQAAAQGVEFPLTDPAVLGQIAAIVAPAPVARPAARQAAA